MIVRREMSIRTWERIDDRLHNIMRNAAEIMRRDATNIKANDIYRDADMCTALIRNLSVEIQMEDSHVDETSTDRPSQAH